MPTAHEIPPELIQFATASLQLCDVLEGEVEYATALANLAKTLWFALRAGEPFPDVDDLAEHLAGDHQTDAEGLLMAILSYGQAGLS